MGKYIMNIININSNNIEDYDNIEEYVFDLVNYLLDNKKDVVLEIDNKKEGIFIA
jgi:hypothetical protein